MGKKRMAAGIVLLAFLSMGGISAPPRAKLEVYPMPSGCGPCHEWLKELGLLFIHDIDLGISNLGDLASTEGKGTFKCYSIVDRKDVIIHFKFDPIAPGEDGGVSLMLPQGLLFYRSEGIRITLRYSDSSGVPRNEATFIKKCHMGD